MVLRNVNASWAVRDVQILKEKHIVTDCFINKRFYLNLKWIFQTLQSDIIFLWFASLSFYPVLLLAKFSGKKIILVSGGFDAAYAPTINYGAFTKNSINRWFRKKIFSLADRILCVSKSNLAETIINAEADIKKCEVVYHGFEQSIPQEDMKPWDTRKNQILMISESVKNTFYRKGIDQFLKLSHSLPGYDFILMGRMDPCIQEYLKRHSPSNIKTTGYITFNSKEFCSIMNDSKYILQLSYYESFGCSVLDGAIAGCYPIVYDQFALPELITHEGKTFPFGSIHAIKQFIEGHETFNNLENSQHVLNKFSYQTRRDQLLKNIEI